jgi:hypothetical protein
VPDNPEFDDKNKKKETVFFAVVMPGFISPPPLQLNQTQWLPHLTLPSLSLYSLCFADRALAYISYQGE